MRVPGTRSTLQSIQLCVWSTKLPTTASQSLEPRAEVVAVKKMIAALMRRRGVSVSLVLPEIFQATEFRT